MGDCCFNCRKTICICRELAEEEEQIHEEQHGKAEFSNCKYCEAED